MTVIAFFPGAFDPVTLGHVDIVERASRIFGHIIIGIYEQPQKHLMFSVAERKQLFSQIMEPLCTSGKVSICSYNGLTVNMAKQVNASVIVRGLRIGSDFEYEREMALMNRDLEQSIDTVCLLSSLENQFVSSSRVKEIARLGGDISRLVPKPILAPMLAKIDG